VAGEDVVSRAGGDGLDVCLDVVVLTGGAVVRDPVERDVHVVAALVVDDLVEAVAAAQGVGPDTDRVSLRVVALELVVAGPASDHVVADVAGDLVVARAAVDDVIPDPGVDDVVTLSAGDP